MKLYIHVHVHVCSVYTCVRTPEHVHVHTCTCINGVHVHACVCIVVQLSGDVVSMKLVSKTEQLTYSFSHRDISEWKVWSLSLSIYLSLSISRSLSHSLTHSLSVSLSLSHSHTHTLILSLSLSDESDRASTVYHDQTTSHDCKETDR